MQVNSQNSRRRKTCSSESRHALNVIHQNHAVKQGSSGVRYVIIIWASLLWVSGPSALAPWILVLLCWCEQYVNRNENTRKLKLPRLIDWEDEAEGLRWMRLIIHQSTLQLKHHDMGCFETEMSGSASLVIIWTSKKSYGPVQNTVHSTVSCLCKGEFVWNIQVPVAVLFFVTVYQVCCIDGREPG
jgi:hypothetical protein